MSADSSLYTNCCLSMIRYFADNVRDDYAAGQLDSQVRIQGLSLGTMLTVLRRLRASCRRCEDYLSAARVKCNNLAMYYGLRY